MQFPTEWQAFASGGVRTGLLMRQVVLEQAELARRTGVAVTSLSDILNGKRRFSPRILAKSAEYFGVAPSFFA
jgi:HTH-type transcriptional regulator/antitoxin HigA